MPLRNVMPPIVTYGPGSERPRSKKTAPPRAPGRPRTWKDSGEPDISDPTITGMFRRGYLADADGKPIPGPDGKPVPVIVRMGKDKEGNPLNTTVHIGDIRPAGRYQAYEISSARKLKLPEWSAYVTVTVTDREGFARTIDIAAGDLRQPVTKAQWLDDAGIAFSGRATYVRDLIRILAMNEPVSVMIQGQGPFICDDGSPNCSLSKRLTFATRSLVFDTENARLPHKTDLGDLPASVDYYDLTPASEIQPGEIREGCELFARGLDECPGYPAIPAAMTGQLFTGFLAAVSPACFSAVFLTGRRGSGKSRYAARFDSIQARNRDAKIFPAVNLGDMRRTMKGPGYRYANFGGFTITVDDVLKEGDTEYKIRDQSQIVSDMIRSFEAGGGALGKVDHARNKVTGTESPSLHSSVRIMSEIPIEIESTLERMIVLPHITTPYGDNGAFDLGISAMLSSPESREAMHRAYSAYVQWIFSRIGTELDTVIEKARIETDTWNVPSRTQEKYATVIAGLLAFARFANSHGVDVSGKITRAITALRDNATAQASVSVPLAELWARDLRAAIINGKIAFPGCPVIDDATGHETGMYGPPYRAVNVTDESGIGHEILDMPFDARKLGLTLTRDSASPVPASGAKVYGFLMHPREDSGGHDGNPITREWYIAMRPDAFTELCRAISRDGRVYRPDDVARSLRDDVNQGARDRAYMPKRTRAVIIRAAWTLETKDDN